MPFIKSSTANIDPSNFGTLAWINPEAIAHVFTTSVGSSYYVNVKLSNGDLYQTNAYSTEAAAEAAAEEMLASGD